MKKLLATTAIFAALVMPGVAGDLVPDARVSLGCTPQPMYNSRPDSNPTTRINLDLQFADENGKMLDTPIFSSLHFLADGGRADRWLQYQFERFEFIKGDDGSGRFVFMG